MNNIGFGFFCFGEDYYYKGTIDKLKKIINSGFKCYVLTENPEYFYEDFSPEYLTIYEYDRTFKSYSDKLILPKKILKHHDICILIDSDVHIMDYSFIDSLKKYNFKYGVSYIDTLENHKSKRKFVKELIDIKNVEWSSYDSYVSNLCPLYGDFETIWEYFLVINKIGFNIKKFYNYYEKLQIVKEFSDIPLNKQVSGAGEGISIQISAKLSESQIQRDNDLYNIIKDKMVSVSRRYTHPDFLPEWMK